MKNRLDIIINNIQSGVLMVDRYGNILQYNKKCSALLDTNLSDCKNLLDIFFENTPSLRELELGIESKSILYTKNNKTSNIIINIARTQTGESILTLEKSEILQKRVSNIIGSKAYFTFDDIISRSRGMQNAISIGKLVATIDSNVLITGESGTGKELFAQAIHNASDRKSGPFLAINCGALPKSLIESELFGYVGSAFTGADKAGRAGKFELANGGTIFLDEIGDMPFEVQVNLLRVIQNREVYRIGSGRSVKIDVRIIAATNENLSKEIEQNNFRSDLYYRLNVFNIYIPPLRDRKEDIRILADFFFKRYIARSKKEITSISQSIYEYLELCPWNGNVRELENYIERAVYATDSDTISISNISKEIFEIKNHHSKKTPKHHVNKDEIINALITTNCNINKCAIILSCSRKTLYRKFIEFSIDYKKYRK